MSIKDLKGEYDLAVNYIIQGYMMSKVDVAKRFSVAIKNKDNFQSVSLPIVSDTSEIIFFYYASSTETAFIFEDICNIAIRKVDDSEVTIKNASAFFTDNEIAEIMKPQVIECLTGNEALECVWKYYDLHEIILKNGFKKSTSEKEKELLKSHIRNFSLIVPKSNLRRIYFRLGESMFNYIYKQTGEKLDL